MSGIAHDPTLLRSTGDSALADLRARNLAMGAGKTRIMGQGLACADGSLKQRLRKVDAVRRAFVAPWMTDWVNLVRVRIRHRHLDGTIDSPHIEKGAVLGMGIIVGEGARISAGVRVGDYCGMNFGVVLSSGHLGKYCCIGHNALIGVPNHAMDRISTYPGLYHHWLLGADQWESAEVDRPPLIGHDVWIGANAMIMQGVSIGHGAVIAAGAVVTRDVEPYAIVGGIPAKTLKYRFEPDAIQYLLDSEWWNLPLDELQKTYGHLFLADSAWHAVAQAEAAPDPVTAALGDIDAAVVTAGL